MFIETENSRCMAWDPGAPGCTSGSLGRDLGVDAFVKIKCAVGGQEGGQPRMESGSG